MLEDRPGHALPRRAWSVLEYHNTSVPLLAGGGSRKATLTVAAGPDCRPTVARLVSRFTGPGSILGNRVRRVEDPELIRGRAHLRRRPAGSPRTRTSPSSCAARSRTRRITVLDTPRPTRPPAWSPCSPRDLARPTPVPSFAEVERRVGAAAAGRRSGAVRRRPGRAGRRRDPRAGGRRGRAGRRRLRPARRGRRHGGGAGARRPPAVRRARHATSPSPCARHRRRGDPLAGADGRGPRPDREPADRHRADRGQRDPRRPRPDGDGPAHRLASPPSTRTWRATCWREYTGLEKAQVRVVAPHVGGAFGGKAGIAPDHGAVVAAARALGRPVAWTETRSEAMLSMHGRGQVQFAELGLTRDGRITGLRARDARRLRRVRRLRRHARRRPDAHDGPGPLRDPRARLRRASRR